MDEDDRRTSIWKDIQRFLKRLNRQLPKTDWAYRLPTEAEWEYACRSGTNTRYYYGDDTLVDSYGDRAQRLGEYAWYRGNLRFRTHAVGQKKPNAWGLHDMLGNISEFCADWYDCDYYANSPLEDPTGPTSGWGHVLRGGKWNSTAWECRQAYRDNSQDSEHRNYYQGLRVVFGPLERSGQ
ncbi:MAG: formylglycine-generating enzyme family protein [Planctomycetaceae bacterium]|nr:MAG: formylglycine-generating enzyme family protein [Planctomycetaceae bacterium]